MSKINLLELLKNTPKGATFYSPTFGLMKFEGCKDEMIAFIDSTKIERYYYPDGKYYRDAECSIFPSRECRNWDEYISDLPENTPVMVCTNDRDWLLRFYAGRSRAYNDGKRCGNSTLWRYIVPVDKFDFTNCSFKKEDNYGTNSK